MLHVRACARKSRLIFNPRSSEKSSLRVRQSLAYRGDSSLITKKNKIKSAPRVTFRTLILSLPFNNFAATHSLCTLIYILSTFLFQPPPPPLPFSVPVSYPFLFVPSLYTGSVSYRSFGFDLAQTTESL